MRDLSSRKWISKPAGVGMLVAGGLALLQAQVVSAEVLKGTMRNNANTCPWPIFVINNDDCTYNNSNAVIQVSDPDPPDPWVGPGPSSAFYASSLGDNSVDPMPGDGKVSPPVTAEISIGAGNVVSGTITIGAVAVHNFSAGASTGRGEESWTTRTLTLSPKAADIVDGTTLIIGDAGYPAYLQPDALHPGGDEFTSELGADSNGSAPDVPYWAGPEPSGIGIATWETEGGATTSIGTTAQQVSTGYSCTNTPNAPGNPCGSDSALENRGEFENVLLKIFTNGAGRVTGVEGILVQEAINPFVTGFRTWVAWRFSAFATPDAVDDEFSVLQNSVANVLQVGVNDINFADPTTATISAQPDQGGTALEGNSPGDPVGITVEYTPASGFAGTEAFAYTMDDGLSADSATVTVTVLALGANDDVARTGVDTPVTIAVGSNDFGFSDPTTLSISVPPANGIAVPGNSPGDPGAITVTYTPDPGFTGIDTFVYAMTDAVGADIATVTVTVENLLPVAPDASIDTSENAPVDILVDDIPGVSFGNEPASVIISRAPVNGVASVATVDGRWVITYTPNQFFSGADSLEYTIEDADGEFAAGTITIDVSGSIPVANDDAVTLAPIAVQAIDVRQNDNPGSGALARHQVHIAQSPSHGTATVDADQKVVYTPEAGFSGAQDLLRYVLEDEAGDLSAPANVVITVTPLSSTPQLPAPKVSALDGWSAATLTLIFVSRRRRGRSRCTAVR